MVSVQNLVKNYKDFKLDITLEIPNGRITGLVGKNGSGKTTTINSILGLIRSDSGSVKLFGKNVTELTGKDKEKIGVALADSCFSPYFTVNDMIAISKKMYKDFDEASFRRKSEKMGLPFNKPMKNFSTGMKAKVRVLLALGHKAKFLILDEPTAGLDVESRLEILELLREYVTEDEQCSILITSHISSDLEGLCDDIYLIHQGKVVLHEDTDRLLDQYGILRVTKADYDKLDKTDLLRTKEEAFGYSCFTNEKQYYLENYPQIVIEGCGIDDMILMLAGGR